MVFHIAGEAFELKVGLDGELYAVFDSEAAADYAHGKGFFFLCPQSCFGGFMNAFRLCRF